MPDVVGLLGLAVDDSGAVQALARYTGSAHNAGKATEHFERTTKNLTIAMKGLGAFFATRQLVEYADAWTLISARVGLVTNSVEQQRAVQQRLFEIANRTRNTLNATSVLYTRLALNADQLGRSQDDLLRVTEAVNASMLISGATGVEAAQAMRQLAQALGSGRVQGDEFRTMMEAMPLVARVVSDAMGVPIGKLKDLSAAGKVEVQAVIDALLARHDELVERAEKMPFTVGQSFEIFQNHLQRTIGILNEGVGITALFGKAIRTVAAHMNQLVAVMGGLAAAMIAYRAAVIATIPVMVILFGISNRQLIVQTLLTARGAVVAWFALAGAIKRTADAMALLQLVSLGALRTIGGIVGLIVGVSAYILILKQIKDATDEYAAALQKADLEEALGVRAAAGGDNKVAERIRDIRQELEDLIRVATQQVALAGMSPEEQARTELHFKRVNQLIERRREIEGLEGASAAQKQALLAETIRALDIELQLGLAALETAAAYERQVEAAKELSEARQNIADSVRQANQAVVLAGLDGTEAARMRVTFDAINAAAEARIRIAQSTNLDSQQRQQILEETMAAIALQERLGLKAIDIGEALKNQKDVLQAQATIVNQFAENLQRAFGNLFNNILKDGLKTFKDLFNAIESIITRFFADLASAKLMEKFGPAFKGLATKLTNSPETQAAAAAVAMSREEALGHLAAAGQVVPVQLEGITATASRSLSAQIAEAMGPALAGFTIGNMIGRLTSNRTLGTGGGLLGGAAAGAGIGSLIPGLGTVAGGVIGAVTGALGGFLASSERHREELKRHAEILKANSERLRELRESFEGAFVRNNQLGRLAEIMDAIQRSQTGEVFATNVTTADLRFIIRMAEELGITLFDNGKIVEGALQQLQEAIELTIKSMTTFGDNLADITKQVEVERALFGGESPQSAAQDAFKILQQAAPELLARFGLDNLDVATKGGRDALMQGFRDIYELIASGQLTPDLLGAFSDKNQLLDAILRVVGAFQSLEKELLKVTTDFPRAMDIVYYERKFGTYGAGYPDPNRKYTESIWPWLPQGSTPQQPRDINTGMAGFYVAGDVVIRANSEETGEQILSKVERAAYEKRARGGYVILDRDVPN